MIRIYGKFDSITYYKAYPDVKAAGMDAEQHFAVYGITEGRKGFIVGSTFSGSFSPDDYLECNEDVRDAGFVDGKEHYKQHGYKESREICIQADGYLKPTKLWSYLAKEGERFTVDGRQIVRYGYGRQWATKPVINKGHCTYSFFGCKQGFGRYGKNTCEMLRPDALWQRIAAEGGKFIIPDKRAVRYGARENWIIKISSNLVECTNAFFDGDPVPGVVKTCEVFVPDMVFEPNWLTNPYGWFIWE